MVDEDKLETLRDLTKFSPKFLYIRGKGGGRQRLEYNRAQLYIHERLEAQLRERGYVRAIILKGRQQGCSTYVQSRYFRRVITRRGTKAFILTHEADATKNLFEMTKRFYDNLEPGFCPVADKMSAKELLFTPFDSGYGVGTAGSKGTGRSQTNQLFHGSEVGFWPDAETHAKGVLQTIADLPDTEIILESTANGIGNYFHGMWKRASSGDSEFQAIFVPWYWQNEYAASADGFECTEEELELLEYHGGDGLTKEHLAWRRKKIGQSKDSEAGFELFKQEYPFTANEAFLNPIANIFIPSRLVMKARKSEITSDAGLIIGVDPAIGDRDRTAIIRRKGRCAYGLSKIANHNTMEICGLLKRLILSENPVKVYVDCIGIGAGIVDRMKEMGYDQVEGINVSRTANDKEHYRNRRAELWGECLDWLSQDLPVQLPDDDDLHGELCGVGYKYDSSGRLQIESKDEMRARGMPSPDCADALMHTFAGGFYAASEGAMPNVRPAHERSKFT